MEIYSSVKGWPFRETRKLLMSNGFSSIDYIHWTKMVTHVESQHPFLYPLSWTIKVTVSKPHIAVILFLSNYIGQCVLHGCLGKPCCYSYFRMLFYFYSWRGLTSKVPKRLNRSLLRVSPSNWMVSIGVTT